MSPTIVTLRNMAQHVFVDESKARAYLLVAVAVDDREVAGLRKTMRSMLLRGQSRIHFRKEQSARRRAILSALGRNPLDITVIRSSLHAENRARDECFAALATAIRWLPSSTLVIERDESRMHVDPRIVHDAFQALADQRPRYEVMPARAEPGLWAADAVAWAIQRGNEWAERVAMHEIHWVDLRG
jgi:hypothetical protein